MQKNGDWENRVDMKLEELSIKLKNFVDDILSAYKILMNIIKSDYAARIIQHESYIFYTKSCEIKLIKQFGKEDKYLFEVELSDNSDDLEELLNQLDLLKYIRKTDVSFWNKWNEDVNLTSSDLSEQELKKLIQTYLDIN